MRSIRLLVPLLLAAPLAAQNATPRLEVGVDYSYWELPDVVTRGPSSSWRTGTVRAGVLLPTRLPATLGLSASYAPGLLGFGGEFAQRVSAGGPDDMNVFLGVGAGMVRLTDDEEEEDIDCNPENGCIDESPGLPEDWRPTLGASLGADVPIARGAVVQPVLQLLRPFGEDGGEGTFIRLGIGLAWRP